MTAASKPMKASVYALEEPTTGLYIVLGADRARLTSRRDASRFTTRRAATLAAQHIADQPHELVRIDRV